MHENSSGTVETPRIPYKGSNRSCFFSVDYCWMSALPKLPFIDHRAVLGRPFLESSVEVQLKPFPMENSQPKLSMQMETPSSVPKPVAEQPVGSVLRPI